MQILELRVVREHLDRRAELEPEGPLEDAHLGVLVVLGQRDRPAVAPGASRATAAMQVVLAIAGRLVVDDRSDVVDVDAAGRHVGGHQHVQFAVGEPLERTLASRLGEVAVDGSGLHAEVLELLLDPVARALGLAEHDGLANARGDRRDDLVLVHVVHGQEEVEHGAHRVGGRIDGDLDRILHVPGDEVADVTVERCREQHRLTRCGALAQDPLDLRGEPVVGHAVGLVEHQHLHPAEVEFVLLQQVDEAQRGGDHHVDTVLQLVDLLMPAGAAVHGQHGAVAPGGHGHQHLGHLQGELTGGHQHQGEGSARLGLAVQTGEQRDTEGERLAGAGAGTAAHVLALEGDRDCLGLDGERGGEPGGVEAAVDQLGHAELDETGGNVGGVDRRCGRGRSPVLDRLRGAAR